MAPIRSHVRKSQAPDSGLRRSKRRSQRSTTPTTPSPSETVIAEAPVSQIEYLSDSSELTDLGADLGHLDPCATKDDCSSPSEKMTGATGISIIMNEDLHPPSSPPPYPMTPRHFESLAKSAETAIAELRLQKTILKTRLEETSQCYSMAVEKVNHIKSELSRDYKLPGTPVTYSFKISYARYRARADDCERFNGEFAKLLERFSTDFTNEIKLRTDEVVAQVHTLSKEYEHQSTSLSAKEEELKGAQKEVEKAYGARDESKHEYDDFLKKHCKLLDNVMTNLG